VSLFEERIKFAILGFGLGFLAGGAVWAFWVSP
jgi:tagatose-1,6-bisphosphate aldolase